MSEPVELDIETDVEDEVPTAIPLTEPADGTPPVVVTEASLSITIDSLASGTGPIAVDAERAGGYRYTQGAFLLQFRRAGSGTHLIDPVPLSDLSALNDALVGTEWVLHAAPQDLPCLAELNLLPSQLFDTEVAARLLGKPRVGLAALVESELGLALAKEHSAVDWSKRPLPEPWLRYAALDVEVLVELRDILEQELREVDRWEWAQEEFEYLRTAPEKPTRPDRWRKTSGIHRLRAPAQLALVRELWVERDRIARTRDIAPGRTLADSAIAAAATANPESQESLAKLPAFSGRGARRNLDAWWSAIKRARSLTVDQLPGRATPSSGPPPHRSWPDRDPGAAARLTQARNALAAISATTGIAAETLLTPATVRALCWTPPEDLSASSVAEALTELGARRWQIAICARAFSEAFIELRDKPPASSDGDEQNAELEETSTPTVTS